MDIELTKVTVGEVIDGFVNREEEGVYGLGGILNIRPKYQREFVYSESQAQAVIDTIFKGYPLNVMYWVENPGGNYEVLDGQQRTLSFCSFANGEFMAPMGGRLKSFVNLCEDEKERFLSYELQIYICKNGTESERLEWFRIINIAGERLTEQEIRNAVYPGNWVTDAKKHFSKTGCPAKGLADNLLSGKYIRQEALETVLEWCADADRIGGRQGGVCPLCGRTYLLGEMEADHITPWSQGGRTTADNCQMLCRDCNRRKGGI